MTGSLLQARESRILGALVDGPLSAKEIERKLRVELWNAWADKHGFEIEWDTEREPAGARILALHEADDLGLPHVAAGSAHSRLVALERKGKVERVQIPGHRPMLWRLPRA